MRKSLIFLKRTFAIFILIIILCLFSRLLICPIQLMGTYDAGLSGVPDASYTLVDTITYRFRDPQKGELVMFSKTPEFSSYKSNYLFQRVASQEGNTLYLRGDLWPDKIPSIAISKEQVIGRIILVPSFLAYLFSFWGLLIISFVLSLLISFLSEKFRKK